MNGNNGFSQAHKFSSTQCTVASFPAERMQHSSPHTLHNFCECSTRPTEDIMTKPVTQFSGYAPVDITNVLSGYFMTIDMHKFALTGLCIHHLFIALFPMSILARQHNIGSIPCNNQSHYLCSLPFLAI